MHNKIRDAEEMISQLKGVNDVKIIISDDNKIQEIHIIARSGRHPKQIVRDVEAVCNAKFDLSIDHKKISIAQIGGYGGLNSTSRLRIACTSIVSRDKTLSASVTLEYKGEKQEAAVSGGKSRFNQLRLIVEAGLKAATAFLSDCVLTLDNVKLLDLGDRSVILVSVLMNDGQVEELLLGTSFIDYEQNDAALKAALNAINRRFPVLADRSDDRSQY